MRRLLAILAIVATLITAAACTPDDNRAQLVTGRTRISLGVIPIVDVAPVYLGKQHGFFSSRGIDLTLVPEQGGAPIIKGVLAGRYQFGFSNMTSLMSARIGGAPLKVIANGVASTGRPGRDFSAVMVRNGSPIHTARDLAGMRIAVNTLGNIGDTTIRQSVRKAGGDPSGIRFEAMPFPAMPGALQAGEVDAVWVVEPQLSETLTQGGQVVASNFVDTAADLTVAGYFTTTGLMAKDPALVARFTAAVNQSLRYASEHPEEVRAIIGTYTKISDVVRTAMILPVWPNDVNRASVERLAVLGRQDGVFPRAPVLDQLLP
ncbi:MAG TPA: ABC transporter substrate-binding protein [Actinoplanes sp.]|jgi:NitT/TauT family transport system substrate-binding protein